MARQTDMEFAVSRQSLTNLRMRGGRLAEFVSVASRFDGCSFRDVQIADASLGEGGVPSVYVDCVFDGCQIRQASGIARFERCSFRDIDLRGWDSTTIELVDCTFTGRFTKVLFYGHPNKMNMKEGEERVNEFHGNDFTGVEMVDTEFRWGIDLTRQKLPDGPQYLYLPDSAATVAHVREMLPGLDPELRRKVDFKLRSIEREISYGQTQALLRTNKYLDQETLDFLRTYATTLRPTGQTP
jgi:hypothetical protein